jgi:hypothetical protein
LLILFLIGLHFLAAFAPPFCNIAHLFCFELGQLAQFAAFSYFSAWDLLFIQESRLRLSWAELRPIKENANQPTN